MSQMVLPQVSPKGQPDNGVKPASGGREKSGDSHFDSVSRAEQQRLDKKQAEKRDQARNDEAAGNEQVRQDTDDKRPDDRKEASSTTETPAKNTQAREEAGDSTDTADAAAGASDGTSQQAVDESSPEETIPLTFAGLQALLMPAAKPDSGTTPVTAATGSGPAGVGGAVGGVQAFAGIMAGLPGATGSKVGQGSGNTAGAAAGMNLAEGLMSGLTAETSRTQETPLAQGALRFQAAAELASQQSVNPNSAKLPAEAAAFRGYTTSIDVPVNHAEWGDKLVGKLTWLTARNMSVAEIHLTPPDMGPMEVRVQVQQEQANITVHSANPAVRDQLELHSHRLRDMLNEQGLSLEQFDVSDSPQHQTGEEGPDEQGGNGSGALADSGLEDQDLQPESLDLTWKGEVDIFA